MEGKRFIQKIKLTNFLSFGPEGMELELEPLNVLIGPNASGKSNFIEAFRVLAALPSDLSRPFREGGGVAEWVWKGEGGSSELGLETAVVWPAPAVSLEHRLWLGVAEQRAVVEREEILGPGLDDFGRAISSQRYRHIGAGLAEAAAVPVGASRRGPFQPIGDTLRREWTPVRDLDTAQSVLAQRRDPQRFPEITYLGQQFGQIALYRDWRTGPRAGVKQPEMTDEPPDHLEEDGRNLFLVLNNLEQRLPAGTIADRARRLHQLAERMTFSIFGSTVLLYLHEEGLRSPVPATRVSDGTLRYLSLLAILLHPDPPPLICIEEPELGLHPDVIRSVGELLIEASQRTQLIVTTHSDYLVSALGDVPESVVVCERDEGGTRMQRLEPEKLGKWLKEYTLGDLWSMGELGGNRW